MVALLGEHLGQDRELVEGPFPQRESRGSSGSFIKVHIYNQVKQEVKSSRTRQCEGEGYGRLAEHPQASQNLLTVDTRKRKRTEGNVKCWGLKSEK